MDEQQIKEQYRAFYRAAIAKDGPGMEATLDERFHLTHMTGMRQSRGEYIRSILRGTMNYFPKSRSTWKQRVAAIPRPFWRRAAWRRRFSAADAIPGGCSWT